MNAGTCWGKNTIDPRGRGIERPRKATLPFFTFSSSYLVDKQHLVVHKCGISGSHKSDYEDGGSKSP
jgi:hypothetical protein